MQQMPFICFVVPVDANVTVEQKPVTTPKVEVTKPVVEVVDHAVVGFEVDGHSDKTGKKSNNRHSFYCKPHVFGGYLMFVTLTI